jgi:steroid 5-alpha reductase family enzyme
MALPAIKTLAGCSDIYRTVLPYTSQLYDLPHRLLQSWSNPTGLQNIYMATNPLISAFAFSLSLAPIFLIVSEINKNYSQVDRCWSILPTMYNAHYAIYAHMNGLPTQRLDSLLAFSTVWSVSTPFLIYLASTNEIKLRLTFNYWRKGGYNIGSEDYRW